MSNIPKKAKKVFEGIIFDVYQWQQKMFDGTEETFEMLKRPDTVQVIATAGDKIYLAEQEQPFNGKFHSVLGGRVDQEDDHLAAAQRELLEEGGLQSDDWELWKSYDPLSKLDWSVHVYIARNCKKVAEQNLDAGEKITVKQVDFDEFIKVVCSESFWGGELARDILRMRVSRGNELERFKNIIFKK